MNRHKPGLVEAFINFFYAIGLPPMFLLKGLITLLLLGLVIGGLFFVTFSNPFESGESQAERREPESTEGSSSSEPANDPLGLDEQIDDIYLFSIADNGGFVVVFNQLQSEQAKIDELLELPELTEDQRRKLNQTKLRHSKSLLQQKLRMEILEPKDIDEFKELAQSLIAGKDSKLADLAGFALVQTGVSRMVEKPSPKISEELIESFQANKTTFVDNEKRANLLLVSLLNAQERHSNRPYVEKTVQEFGRLLGESENDSVKKLSGQVAEFFLFSEFDLKGLENKVRFRSDDALDDLDNALRVLAEHPEADMKKWRMLIRAYEPALSNGQPQVLETGWKIVDEILGKLPDTDERKARIAKTLWKQRKRALMLGKPLKIEGTDPNGKPIDQMKNKSQILIFANGNPGSVELLKELREQQSRRVQFNRPVLVFKNPFTENDHKQLELIGSKLRIVSFETAEKLIETISVEFYPYIVLVDKNGAVTGLDLSLIQAANRIAGSDK